MEIDGVVYEDWIENAVGVLSVTRCGARLHNTAARMVKRITRCGAGVRISRQTVALGRGIPKGLFKLCPEPVLRRG